MHRANEKVLEKTFVLRVLLKRRTQYWNSNENAAGRNHRRCARDAVIALCYVMCAFATTKSLLYPEGLHKEAPRAVIMGLTISLPQIRKNERKKERKKKEEEDDP